MASVGRLMLKAIFPVFLLLLAMSVGWYLYPSLEPRWAEVTEFRAVWDQQTSTIELGLVIDKHADCRRTPVLKFLQPLISNDIQAGERVMVNGNLPKKIQRLPNGVHWVPDRARPRNRVPPGQYILTVQVKCEQEAPPPSMPLPSPRRGEAPPLADPVAVPPSNPLFETDPVQTIIIVPEIPVRVIPKESRLYRPEQKRSVP